MPVYQQYPATQQSLTNKTNVIIGRNVSICEITYDGVYVTGEAKRNKGEKWDSAVATDLAVGRAFATLGDLLVQRGMETLDRNLSEA